MPKLEIPNSNRVDWRDWKTYCVLPFVLFFYGQWEAIKSLRNKVYDISGWSGGFFFELFALAAAAGAAVTAAEAPPVPYFGWLHSFGQGVVGWYITYAFLFPIIWLSILRPAWEGVKWCWDHFDFVDKQIVGPLMQAVPKIFSWLPGAGPGWARIKEDNWFVILLGGISYATLALSALYLGWETKSFITGAVHLSGFANEFVIGAAWAAGLVVAGLAGRLFLGAISEGKKEGIGTLLAAVATYAARGWVGSFAEHLSIPSWGGIAVTFILCAAYGLPLLYTIFASGFWKRVWKAIEPTLENFFEGKETSFRHVVLQLFGVALSIAIAYGVWLLCAALGLGLVVSTVVPALVLLVAYAGVDDVIDQSWGNALVAIIGSLALAVFAGFAYVGQGYVFGIYGAIAAGVITTIASMLVIPLLYGGVEWFATLPGIVVVTNWLGAALPRWHKAYIDSIVQPTIDKCELLYNEGYGHNTGSKDAIQGAKYSAFRKLALHITNWAVALTLAFLATAGTQQLAFLHGFSGIVGLVVGAVVLVFSLGLLGKAILNTGLELPGVIVSLLTGLKVAAMVLPAVTAGVWVAVPAGLVTAAFTMWIGFPAVMILVRALTSWAAAGLNIRLDWVTTKSWAFARGFWKSFVRLFDYITDLLEPVWKWVGSLFAWIGRGFLWVGRLLAPIWLTVAGICASIWNTCRGSLERLLRAELTLPPLKGSRWL